MNSRDKAYIFVIIISETVFLLFFVSKALSSRKNIICCCILLSILQIVRIRIFGSIGAHSILPSLLIDLLIVSVGFEGKLWKKILLLTFFYAFIFIYDCAAAMIFLCFSQIVSGDIKIDSIILPATVFSKILIIPTSFLFKGMFNAESNLSKWAKYLAVPAFTVIALTWAAPFSQDISRNEIFGMLTLITTFGLLVNVFSIISIGRLLEKSRLENRLDVLQENRRLGMEYHQELQRRYSQIEKTAHDIKYHLTYIENANDIESIKRYIQTIRNRGLPSINRYTGNFDIDTILNALNNDLGSKNIKLNIGNILLGNLEWIDAYDIFVLLGNGISNAAEACERANAGEVNLHFNASEDWFLITIENPTNEIPLKKKSGFGFISSKKGGRHGIGIESMIASVKRYDGDMKYEIENGVCRLDIMLQKTFSTPNEC